MADKTDTGDAATADVARFLEVETGARHPQGFPRHLLFWVPVVWSLFQLWIASPLPFWFGVFILNDTETRAIHLAFAVFLVFLSFPLWRRAPRSYIPIYDWVLAVGAAFCAAYLFLFYTALSNRPGLPTTLDLAVGIAGVLLLLDAARRALGLAIVTISVLALAYVFLGPYLPELISHKGASLPRAVSHFWLTTEGVFGVALGVSTNFVFLFVLFGALLERAGAGNYFIKISFALLGHLRGGPAKAAVVSSGLTGVISGSSIANVVTTGTFTIPLMKRVGYAPEKAGAFEVAASVNGQIMPPVMGAAAFLIAEYVGIPYVEVVRHAFVPAIVTYIALFYLVHIEALKADIRGLPRRQVRPWQSRLFRTLATVSGFIIIAGLVYYGVGWTKEAFGDSATTIIGVALLAAYILLIWWRSRFPDLEQDDPNAPILELPDAAATAQTGFHFLLPIVVLVWCLMVERLSPGLSAFYATLVLIVIVLTQDALTALFRGQRRLGAAFAKGFNDFLAGLRDGGVNMIGVAIATAAAGIIVGTVSLTGIGLVMTELVELISGGSLMIMLLLTAVICLILGMGLPTTANYIVVATLMAPVIVELGAKSDLAVPLVAAHLFVFYFGLMADVTPPVGLASFAAAAISGASSLSTGVQAFRYEIRTALLPFIFVFNNELLLIGVDSLLHAAVIIAGSTIAMLLFVAATQGWFLVRSRWWETVLLLAACFILFRPGFLMDRIAPPYALLPGSAFLEQVEATPPGGTIRFRVVGEDLRGQPVDKTVALRLDASGTPDERLADAGLFLRDEEGRLYVDDVRFRTEAAKVGLDLDYEIVEVRQPQDRPPKELFFLLGLALAGLVWWNQRRRRAAAAVPAAG